MKFSDIIEKDRDGVVRPDAEQRMMRHLIQTHTCGTCGTRDLCAYEIQFDTFFCSDECRSAYVSPYASRQA